MRIRKRSLLCVVTWLILSCPLLAIIALYAHHATAIVDHEASYQRLPQESSWTDCAHYETKVSPETGESDCNPVCELIKFAPTRGHLGSQSDLVEEIL
jgi:hypothetical protein